jgi:hypothetical protein
MSSARRWVMGDDEDHRPRSEVKGRPTADTVGLVSRTGDDPLDSLVDGLYPEDVLFDRT